MCSLFLTNTFIAVPEGSAQPLYTFLSQFHLPVIQYTLLISA